MLSRIQGDGTSPPNTASYLQHQLLENHRQVAGLLRN